MIKLLDILKEIEQPINVDNEFAQLGSELSSEVEKALKSKQLQEEDIATAAQVLDVILAAPTVLNFLGDKITQVSNDLNIKKGIQFGSWLSKYSGNLETKFKSPLKSVIGKFTKDPKKQEIVSEALYLIIVAGLGLAAGQGSNETIKQTRANIDSINALNSVTNNNVQNFIHTLG